MLSYLWLSITLLAIVTLVQASPTDLSLLFLERLHQLQAIRPKRQSTNTSLSDFPAQCHNECEPAVNALNTCSAATCLCTDAVDKSMGACIECSVNADPSSTSIASSQQAIDTYNTLCNGLSVTSISFSAPGGSTGSASSANPFSTSLPSSTSTTYTRTTITSLPTLATPSSTSTSAAKPGARSNARFGLISVMITFLVPLLA
ncbi:hypothetical protein AX14_000321 [Amanita brunnescens Koide BX004]|nr:hypothetical protein AX14_000321 [Amanita brunnescens Koide BX004]